MTVESKGFVPGRRTFTTKGSCPECNSKICVCVCRYKCVYICECICVGLCIREDVARQWERGLDSKVKVGI